MGNSMNFTAPNGPGDGAIDITDLTVAYDREPAVHHLNGTFEPGSLTAVIGPNGAGKSTLLKTIVGMLRPDDGHISLGINSRRQIGYLAQQADIDRSFPITVWDTVALGLWKETGIFGAVRLDHKVRIGKALAATGIESLGKRPIGTLSVGQLQRVLFARLLVQDARIILLDEPFAAVDERTTADLMNILARWHAESRTIVAVLHDFDQVRAHFPASLLIAREPVAWGTTASVLTDENLARARKLSHVWGDSPFQFPTRH
jgi:zinc/manganese transport system ATP-binding protein